MARKQASPAESRKAIAYKAIGLAPHLSGTEKAIAVLLIDHLNIHTGRCDLSLQRLAILSGANERTVRRATKKLAGGSRLPDGSCEYPELIRKSSHGGQSFVASYEPDFEAFKAIVDESDERSKLSTRELARLNETSIVTDTASMTTIRKDTKYDKMPDIIESATGQLCHNNRTNLSKDADSNVHQTHIRTHVKTHGTNSLQSTKSADLINAGNFGRRVWSNGSPSHRQIAEKKAHDQIQAGILEQLTKEQIEILFTNLDSETDQASIDAEMYRNGAGVKLLVEFVRNVSRQSLRMACAEAKSEGGG